MGGILEGIRVLDFGRYIAGPFCATLLGDFGAQVIRIEKVRGSEDRYVSPINDSGEGSLFMQMGRNKLGMTLNPMKVEGREIVKKLVSTADVVVANLPYDSLVAMGLDYDSLKASKADIILTTVSAFGSAGPYSNRVGFDGLGQAMSGQMHLTGPADHPVKSFVPYVDYGTASLCAFGTLAALMERQKTGKGQVVEGALLNTALTFNNSMIIEQSVIQANRVGTLNRSQNSAPADTYKTKDGWVLIHTLGQPLFERWVRLMGEDHWLDDPRMQDDQSRGDHGEVISERLAIWCAERSTEDVLRIFEDARLPAGPVLTPQQVLEDPHVLARNLFKDTDYPGLPGPAPVMDTPVRLSKSPGSIRRRSPTLGEHTDLLLAELGYSQAEINELRQNRVV